jgi:hypothetical protein
LLNRTSKAQNIWNNWWVAWEKKKGLKRKEANGDIPNCLGAQNGQRIFPIEKSEKARCPFFFAGT